MQERQTAEEIIKEWEGANPKSVGEARSQGYGKGRIEGREEGREEGLREAACEFAQRLIQDGKPDADIHKYTKLPLEDIAKLRNGG